MLAVTIDSLPGYEIKTVVGQVVGSIARPLNAYTEGIRRLDGHRHANPSAALSRWREEAVAHMVERAYLRGANAVVGMRFDHRTVAGGWTEICAYGTAVFVVPAADGPAGRWPVRPDHSGNASGSGVGR